MYIFASPIQYKTETGYEIIDNTVVESQKDGFAFENKANDIKTYFPQTLSEPFKIEQDEESLEFSPAFDTTGFSEAKKIIFTNMYGDRISAVVYSREDMDLAFYPTKAGIKTELVLKQKPYGNVVAFNVKSTANSFENKRNGYITFMKGSETESIIYQPLVQYENENGRQLDVTTGMEMTKEGGDYHVEIKVDENVIDHAKYPIKLDPSFELYQDCIPDSTVYSKRNVNNYLANYAVVGEHPLLGEGWHYSRLRLNWLMTLRPKDVKSAVYYTKLLCNTENYYLRAYEPSEQWGSMGLLWRNKPEPAGQISGNADVSNGYLGLPMDGFVRECFGDTSWQKESVGFVIMADGAEEADCYAVLAASDNSLYTPYIRIELKDLPRLFVPQDNINPPT